MMKQNEKRQLAVIGSPISHSKSPEMQMAAIRDLGLDYDYQAIHIPDEAALKHFLETLDEQGIRGFNVTIPYKETILTYLDDIHPHAKAIGAVNTVVNNDGRLTGYNTDGAGFLMALEKEHGFSCGGKKVGVVGAGGSSRSIVMALLKERVSKLVIMNRSLDRAERLIADFSEYTTETVVSVCPLSETDELKDLELIINTSSVGMAPNVDECPVANLDWVSQSQLLCDIIYNPKKTLFLKKAEEGGASIMNGAGMLAGQGVLALKLFIGRSPSYDVMRSVL